MPCPSALDLYACTRVRTPTNLLPAGLYLIADDDDAPITTVRTERAMRPTELVEILEAERDAA